MTDKQIIIDGVDVNALYSDQIACMNRYEVARLFIKTVELFVAKEQECEELKECLFQVQNATISLTKQLDQLKAELEQEKALKDTYFACYHAKHEDLAKEYDQLKAENEKLDTENKRLVAELANPVFDSFEELDKLKQTLTKIKEIAEEYQKEYIVNNGFFLLSNQILQKISEVIPNE